MWVYSVFIWQLLYLTSSGACLKGKQREVQFQNLHSVTYFKETITHFTMTYFKTVSNASFPLRILFLQCGFAFISILLFIFRISLHLLPALSWKFFGTFSIRREGCTCNILVSAVWKHLNATTQTLTFSLRVLEIKCHTSHVAVHRKIQTINDEWITGCWS